ncbi:MAG: MBL fold metallo-hydrolase [Spirochaetota bacterium]|nr:MBL fold metallo-hydrolase [Spirochaetota bacterium]
MNNIFNISVSDKEAALALLNTYSTVVLKIKRFTIVFDPVKIKFPQDQNIDIIIVTHEHSDHYDKELLIDLQKQKNAYILTTPYIAKRLGDMGGYVKSLEANDTFHYNGIDVFAEYSNHSANNPLSFVISLGFVNIYHPNDSRVFPEMSLIREKYHPELMLFTGNLLSDVPEMAEIIKPNIILSYQDIRYKDMKIPGIDIKTVKHGEVYIYRTSEMN